MPNLWIICAAALLSVTPVFLQAHEFWIEPIDYEVEESGKVIASIRNGENFQGTNLPFIEDNFRQFLIYDQSEIKSVASRLGDLPALHETLKKPGLHIIVYESTESFLKYPTFEKFALFAEKEDVKWILDEHKKKNFPTKNITEVYTRYAKSLVSGGSPEGQDQYFDLAFELVALTNPYRSKSPAAMRFQLLYQGEPLPDTQLSVFHKDSTGIVSSSVTRTDEAGIASVKTDQTGSYLINAVLAKNPSPETMLKSGALWETLWASSTFSVKH